MGGSAHTGQGSQRLCPEEATARWGFEDPGLNTAQLQIQALMKEENRKVGVGVGVLRLIGLVSAPV